MSDSIAAAQKSGPSTQPDGSHLFEFSFAASDETFAGHFPGRLILPGIFQIEITRIAAETVNHCRFSVREITRAKFQRPILPDEPVKLELKLSEDAGAVSARAHFTVNGRPSGETFLKLQRCD